MAVKEKIAELQAEFGDLEDALMKYTYLIELGTLLPEMAEEDRTEEALVKGCQAKVWLHLANRKGRLIIQADSNTAVMRGALYLVREVYHDVVFDEIADAPKDLFEVLGLNEFLIGRRQGISGIQRMIFDYADKHK